MPPPSRSTSLSLDAVLPLTCTREGTCCHGKAVWVNPWELACLARALTQRCEEVLLRDTTDGGIRLRFEGPSRWRGLPACNLYAADSGCRAHGGRPLACRLYPLGRERRGQQLQYLHDGPEFPCLSGCPTVTGLPHLTVGDYLAAQAVAAGEAVSDAYLEVVQDLAEGAYVLVIDSGLVASGFPGLLARWRKTMALSALERAAVIPSPLLGLLLDPGLDPQAHATFVADHAQRLQAHVQRAFASLSTPQALADASCVMLALALHLAASLGADLQVLARRWLEIAQQQGLR